jgi:hypothetical protein
MKSLFVFCLFTGMLQLTFAQEVTQSLASFDKIVISPKINVVLQKGDKESITIRYSDINEDEINLEIRNHRLHVFLDGSRFLVQKEKRQQGICTFKREKYRNASITAYITYKELNSLVVRGEEEVISEDILTSPKFKLKAYGATDIELASLNSLKFKAKLFGENRLKIQGGEIKNQKYKLYGNNKVDTKAIESQTIASIIYGEASMRVKATDEMALTSFGEPSIQLSGSAYLSKGIVIGNPHIRTGIQ